MKGVIIVNQEVGHNRYKIDRLTDEFTKVNVEIIMLISTLRLILLFTAIKITTLLASLKKLVLECLIVLTL